MVRLRILRAPSTKGNAVVLGRDKMIQAFKEDTFLWIKCKSTRCFKATQGVPSFQLARLRRLRFHWCRETGGQWSGFCVRSGSESDDSRNPEEHVVWTRPQEDRRSVKDQDHTLEEHVTLNTPQEVGQLMCSCQGRACATKNQGTSLLGLGASHFLLGRWKWVFWRPLCKLLERT